jgi:hypothetical protein
MSFFFTELDDSLRPRGSRDPLGIEHLWSRIGRKLVGNLTTVTQHLDNFIVTLVGFHLCVNERSGQTDWESFERFEQLTGHARVRRGMENVLGIRRLKRSADFPVSLGSALEARILDNPQQAGLWGLYSTALASAGLTDGMRRPTALGAQIAEIFLAAKRDDIWRVALDRQRTKIDETEMKRMEKWVLALLSNAVGRKALADRLLSGSGAHQRWHGEVFDQARAFMEGKEDVPPARDFLCWLTSESDLLKNFAERVLRFDEALTLSALTFNWLLGCHGRSTKEIEEKLAPLAKWPFQVPAVPDFSKEISDDEWRQRAHGLSEFCEAMARGAWRVATERLLSHHERVAGGRGGAPWCYWEKDRLKVVMSTTPGVLPTADDISSKRFSTWMRTRSNDFFLRAFLSILHQAGSVAPGGPA